MEAKLDRWFSPSFGVTVMSSPSISRKVRELPERIRKWSERPTTNPR